jgi:CRP-like cAMP-binding protein
MFAGLPVHSARRARSLSPIPSTGLGPPFLHSHQGKEATITFLSVGDFVREETLAMVHRLRLSTAIAVIACSALRITREEMIREMHGEPAFADMFLKFLLARSMRRIQEGELGRLYTSRR